MSITRTTETDTTSELDVSFFSFPLKISLQLFFRSVAMKYVPRTIHLAVLASRYKLALRNKNGTASLFGENLKIVPSTLYFSERLRSSSMSGSVH